MQVMISLLELEIWRRNTTGSTSVCNYKAHRCNRTM